MHRALDESELQQAIQDYQRNGAAVLRNVVASEWIQRLGKGVDALLSTPGPGVDLNRPGEGRFHNDHFAWLRQPDVGAFIRDAGLAELASVIMRSREVRFFYDQLLVKEPGTAKRTPWHQDLPYWPVRGEQILSIWVPIDAASPENGVVTYVKGSHRWNSFFAMDEWSDNGTEIGKLVGTVDPINSPYRRGPNGVSLRDIVDHPERHEFITWNVEPGDVILHHPLVVHGAPGNLSQTMRRRALATRWFGDDARWDDTRPHFLQLIRKLAPEFPYPNLHTGDRIDDPLFPLLWKAA